MGTECGSRECGKGSRRYSQGSVGEGQESRRVIGKTLKIVITRNVYED